MQYWDPPSVGDPRIKDTFSNYGVSYLNQMDVVYFFAGKFARLVRPLVGQDCLALRLFNVALLAGLMLWAWRMPARLRILFLPLCISPQIWYIFSYFNGDAFPLALSFAVTALLALIWTEPDKPQRGRLILLGVLLGFLATSKQNYYVFLVFFACFWLAAQRWTLRRGLLLRQAGLAFLVAAIVFGARFGSYQWAMRHERPAAEARVAEKMAAEEFKPSSQTNGTAYWGLQMRAHGVTWEQMFTGEWKWHIFTFRSAFGKYGPMNIEPPLIFYIFIGRVFAVFVFVLFAGLLWRQAAQALSQIDDKPRKTGFVKARPLSALYGASKLRLRLAAGCRQRRKDRLCQQPKAAQAPPYYGRSAWSEAALLAVFMFLTVFQSFWHSWTADFQSQGRYLFPILAMMACALIRYPTVPARFRRALWWCGLGLWGLSMWSFVAVGLARIAR